MVDFSGDLGGQIGLRPLRVDERVAVVHEDAEVTVDADVDAGRLHHGRVEGIYPDSACFYGGTDGDVGEDHGWPFSLSRW